MRCCSSRWAFRCRRRWRPSCIGRFFGGTWGKLVIGGALLGVSLYLLFDRVLDVTLPLGTVFGG